MPINDLDVLATKLKNYKTIVVSNREPYIHEYSEEEIIYTKPAGGVVTALDPLLQTEIDACWVAWGSGSADPVMVNEKNIAEVPPQHPSYQLKRVWLHDDLIKGYYHGFSNKTLWPLCHNSYVLPKFSESDWIMYSHANELFTKNIVEELDPNKKNIVFINDYHLGLISANITNFIKNNPDYNIKMIMFWHIPWPSWEVFRIMPWKKDILNSMLNLSLLGLQTENDVFNFLRTIQQEYEDYTIDFESGLITKPDNSKIIVKNFPISIDFDFFYEKANQKQTLEKAKEIEKKYKNQFIILSVDRLDYIKGLRHRQQAINKFFERYPDYQEKVIFIQIVSPSRGEIAVYADLDLEIKNQVDKINKKYMTTENDGENEIIKWKPIEYINETLDRDDLLPYYKAAGSVLVSSIQDGMNLVVKEAITSGKDNMAVLLSRWAGASTQLKKSVRFNPFNINEFADSISEMLKLPDDIKKRNLHEMREKIKSYNIYDWIIDIFNNSLKIID